jgi:hypothetical protein
VVAGRSGPSSRRWSGFAGAWGDVGSGGRRTADRADRGPLIGRGPHRVRGLPVAMKILWTIWGSVVAINLIVWRPAGTDMST